MCHCPWNEGSAAGRRRPLNRCTYVRTYIHTYINVGGFNTLRLSLSGAIVIVKKKGIQDFRIQAKLIPKTLNHKTPESKAFDVPTPESKTV